MRRLFATFLALGLLASTAAPALGIGKPIIEANPPSEPIEFAAGEVCDFDVRLTSIIDHTFTITFPESNGRQVRIGGGLLVIKVTNLETNASATYNASGPGKIISDTNAQTETVSGIGPWLVWIFPEDEGPAGLWFTRGRIFEVLSLETFLLTTVELPARKTNVCEVLGGASAPG